MPKKDLSRFVGGEDEGEAILAAMKRANTGENDEDDEEEDDDREAEPKQDE